MTQRVPPIERRRPDEVRQIDVVGRPPALVFERVVAVAAAETGRLAQRVADRVADVAAALVQVELEAVEIREGVAAPLGDVRVALVGTQEVRVARARPLAAARSRSPPRTSEC